MDLPSAPTSVQSVIPSYLYVQYNDDDNLQSFVTAFNAYAQAYLDYMNQLNLPVYTAGNIAGGLLDWVAAGIYGLFRPGLPTTGSPGLGALNTYVYDPPGLPLNAETPAVIAPYTATTDDVYKRVLTWHFWKGDGDVFNMRWLKRRIARFLTGDNGTGGVTDQTYDISVAFTAPRAATITLATSNISTVFKSAVEGGVLELPFQIAWTVTLV